MLYKCQFISKCQEVCLAKPLPPMDLSFMFEPLVASSVGLEWGFAFIECTDVRSEVSVYVGPVDNSEQKDYESVEMYLPPS